jgi:hypothetical protein
VAGTTVNFTTTPTQYSVTRTLDANANKGVWVYLDFGGVGAGVTRTLEFFQLERGSNATSFEFRSIGQELLLCQRYYQIKSQVVTTTGTYTTVHFMTQMRVQPTFTTTFDAGTGATFVNFNGAPGFDAIYQNTNHNTAAQATIRLSAEL